MKAAKAKIEAKATDETTGPGLSFDISKERRLVVQCLGAWRIDQPWPSAEAVLQQLDSENGIQAVVFDTKGLTEWDSSLLTVLLKCIQRSEEKRIRVDLDTLPEGIRRLLKLATSVPEKKDTGRGSKHKTLFVTIGQSTLEFFRSGKEILAFIGEAFLSFTRMFTGRARFRASDFKQIIQECGVQALPIVSLISLLVGLILAFVGAVQLMMFGAQIFVANLVGIAMVRVMGAVMTGIIMAGRTGAAFAAQLGTMQVNEELDAFTTLGISPMDFLVLPRMLALTLMMPLLCIYADLMGVLGGLIVGVGMLDMNLMEYYNQTKGAIRLNDLFIGLFHSVVFGVLVSLASCLRGIQCGRSATAVGQATTSAVVTSIICIIVATAIITIVCNVLGI